MATFPRGFHARETRRRNERLTTQAAGTNTTPAKVTWLVDPSDAITLRGIPAIGRGVAGHIPHTQPEQQATREG